MIYNNQAEQAIISSLLINNDLLLEIIDLIEPSDFWETNEVVFKTILDLFKKGKKFDVLTVSDANKEIKKSYLASIVANNISNSNIKDYCSIVKDCSIRRQILKECEIIQNTVNSENKAESILVDAQNRIMGINSQTKENNEIIDSLNKLKSVQKQYTEKLQQGSKYLGTPCGFHKIDEFIDGLRPGHIWVVGAYTSIGKTQFALNVLWSAILNNLPSSIISLEMSKVDLAARLIGIHSGISATSVIKGIHDEKAKEKIDEAELMLGLSDLNIYNTYFDLEKIKMLIRKDVYVRGVKFVVLDYVQNIISEKGLREYDLLTKSAIDLQSLARELNITILIVSQISNDAEKGLAAEAGFKGTGALEAVADIAIRLKRNKDQEDPNWDAVPVDIKISKNRHGFTGTIKDYNMDIKSGKFFKV